VPTDECTRSLIRAHDDELQLLIALINEPAVAGIKIYISLSVKVVMRSVITPFKSSFFARCFCPAHYLVADAAEFFLARKQIS
jgi:hypothetical protein